MIKILRTLQHQVLGRAIYCQFSKKEWSLGYDFSEIFKTKVRSTELLDSFWLHFVVYKSVDYRKMWPICWLKLIVKLYRQLSDFRSLAMSRQFYQVFSSYHALHYTLGCCILQSTMISDDECTRESTGFDIFWFLAVPMSQPFKFLHVSHSTFTIFF